VTLTLEERETIILFNEKDNTASVDTCNPALIRKLDKQIALQENGTIVPVREDEYGKRYLIPKSWVKVNIPPTYTPEQRAKMRERGIAMRQAQLTTAGEETAPNAAAGERKA